MPLRILISAGLGLGLGVLLTLGARAEQKIGPRPTGPETSSTPKAPIRISEEALHKQGGVPRGWRFTLPVGDPNAGREVFAKLECYKCHEVKGHGFPEVSRAASERGPELTGMGSHHPAEYFAESIINPNAVIITEKGYTGADGLSIMPDYRDSLTVAELIDLVAFLKSLDGERGHAMPKMQHDMPHDKGDDMKGKSGTPHSGH